MKQIIIARKDLGMSPGKLAAQVGHASLAYFTSKISQAATRQISPEFECLSAVTSSGKMRFYISPDLKKWCQEAYEKGQTVFYCKKIPDKDCAFGYQRILVDERQVKYEYVSAISFDTDVYEEWINGSFVKIVCEAKNRNEIIKATRIADDLGLVEGVDYFVIRDNCLTELKPEETDENGVGRTITCVGFRPLPNNIANQISHQFQLYQ